MAYIFIGLHIYYASIDIYTRNVVMDYYWYGNSGFTDWYTQKFYKANIETKVYIGGQL